MTTKDTNLRFQCDALAIDNNRNLMLLSAVASSTAIKALRAVLLSNVRVTFEGSDVADIRYFAKMKEADYHCEAPHKLGVNAWQLLCWIDVPGMLRCSSEEAIWQALKSDAYTTPLLRSWVPWLVQRFLDNSYLLKAICHECNVAYLRMTDEQLDQLVVEGLRSGELRIERRVA